MAEVGTSPQNDPPGCPTVEYDVVFSQGMAFHRAGLLPEAEQFYQRVLEAEPQHFDSMHLLGVIHYQRGDYAEAIRLIDAALRIKPDVADAHNNRANALKKLGRFLEALASYNRAIACKPDDAASFNNRGSVFKDLRQFEQATADFNKAIALQPDFAEAFNNRGNVLWELKRYEEALTDYDRAIVLKPNNADALNNRGNTLNALERPDEALASYERAIAVNPNFAAAFNNRANVLFEKERFEEALEDFNKAIALKPDHTDAICSRGQTLTRLNRIEEALADFDRAIAIKPDDVEALWNRALCRLLVGRYREGWPDYELRWQTVQMAQRRAFRQRQWGGQSDISGKTILLHAEQGFGDTIMAARYIPRVAATGARVILDVQVQIAPLLAGIAGVSEMVARDEALPTFDVHCPLMSLPGAFGTTLDTIPADVPYLRAPSAHLEKWAPRLPRAGAPRVGIAWAGNPHFKFNDQRSIGLRPLLPLLLREGAQFFSLQMNLFDGDADILRTNRQITHLGADIENFADTAAIVSSLDLIISSDTALVHLAGALGKPVWVLLQFAPDWRWLLGRDDSPWYPTARLFRQPQRSNWEAVVSDAGTALGAWLGAFPAATRERHS